LPVGREHKVEVPMRQGGSRRVLHHGGVVVRRRDVGLLRDLGGLGLVWELVSNVCFVNNTGLALTLKHLLRYLPRVLLVGCDFA
jgi:hypothetical protein